MEKKCQSCGAVMELPPSLWERTKSCSRNCRKNFPEKRFWPKVNKQEGKDACWTWTGSKSKDGYGYFETSKNPGQKLAHRQAWIFANGPIPDGLSVLHRCDNPPCVRLDHLFLGTIDENNKDRMRKGRNNHVLGERVGGSKLKANQVIEIRSKFDLGISTIEEIAKHYDTPYQTIWQIIRRRTWRHV